MVDLIRRTRTWLRISSAAVYRNLRRLHEEGYLEAYTTRDGLKPHKTVFSLTELSSSQGILLGQRLSSIPSSLLPFSPATPIKNKTFLIASPF